MSSYPSVTRAPRATAVVPALPVAAGCAGGQATPATSVRPSTAGVEPVLRTVNAAPGRQVAAPISARP
jgi:hypothetical protein